ncbi:MAG: TIGR04149 family rSAM-modified RiPP [Odoribacteraceae bacterium]|jgi:natural product precursor|nr:TIGR04149 family rSAM-modified RiPP [Odoribacteraceae bacterium]
MKKLKKLHLRELTQMSRLEEKELDSCVDGGSDSCVFNCFDYLDGARFSASYSLQQIMANLGYLPDDRGNVQASDVPAIGAFGGFTVTEASVPVEV